MGAAILASVDGEILPPEEATISILDDGLLRGDGAFEVIKLYGHHPFRLDDHVARLRRSADAIISASTSRRSGPRSRRCSPTAAIPTAACGS